MINKGIENYVLKKKNTKREPQPIKCSHFKVMMPLCLSVIYQLCYYTVNKKELLNQLNWLSYICFSLDQHIKLIPQCDEHFFFSVPGARNY